MSRSARYGKSAKNRQKVGKNLKDFSRAVPYKVVKLMKWLNVN